MIFDSGDSINQTVDHQSIKSRKKGGGDVRRLKNHKLQQTKSSIYYFFPTDQT